MDAEVGREARKFVPRLVSLVGELIKFSRGGWTHEEKQKIGEDLALLAADILAEVAQLAAAGASKQ